MHLPPGGVVIAGRVHCACVRLPEALALTHFVDLFPVGKQRLAAAHRLPECFSLPFRRPLMDQIANCAEIELTQQHLLKRLQIVQIPLIVTHTAGNDEVRDILKIAAHLSHQIAPIRRRPARHLVERVAQQHQALVVQKLIGIRRKHIQ